MPLIEDGQAANLEELRSTLTSRVALVLIGTGGIAMLAALPHDRFVPLAFGLGALTLALGTGVFSLRNMHPRLARGGLLAGSTGVLLFGLWLFDTSWLPFLALPLIFTAALLAAGWEVGIALVVGGWAAWLTYTGERHDDLLALLCVFPAAIVLARLAAYTLYEALEWAWSMQQRADDLLEQTRAHRAELSRTLKSLDLAYALQSRTQQELVYARQQAEAARRMKERFAANISHELRTPLNIILGFSKLMALSPEVYGDLSWPPTLRRDVHQIYRSSQHLLAMIDDILDLSHFEIAGFALHREPTQPGALVAETVEIGRDLFRDRPARLEAVIEPDLPLLEVDRTRIRQVLLNLLANASRLIEDGFVRVTARREGAEVIVSVADSGPGIPAEKLPLIFDEYYQVDVSLSRKHGGTGLGLAICKQFVEIHGGRIWVQSQEGAGSTFFIALPIPGLAAPATYLQSPYYSVERPVPEARPRILVVDPDPAVAAMVARRLGQYEVAHISQVDVLAAEVAAWQPQAVVYNALPGQDAPTLPPLPGVPLIRCSLPSHAWIAADLAVRACLTKPVTAERLLAELAGLDGAQRVLIVDDDRGFVQLIERMLAAGGRDYQVNHAYDGERGLAVMAGERPDVVLLDLMMPNVDGFAFLEAMRRQPHLADVPVILLTATSYAEDYLRRCAGRLVIERGEGLPSGEALNCLQALLPALVHTQTPQKEEVV
jgi:signal transduction histidine kinase/CheY-like chemotaxis protein